MSRYVNILGFVYVCLRCFDTSTCIFVVYLALSMFVNMGYTPNSRVIHFSGKNDRNPFGLEVPRYPIYRHRLIHWIKRTSTENSKMWWGRKKKRWFPVSFFPSTTKNMIFQTDRGDESRLYEWHIIAGTSQRWI